MPSDVWHSANSLSCAQWTLCRRLSAVCPLSCATHDKFFALGILAFDVWLCRVARAHGKRAHSPSDGIGNKKLNWTSPRAWKSTHIRDNCGIDGHDRMPCPLYSLIPAGGQGYIKELIKKFSWLLELLLTWLLELLLGLMGRGLLIDRTGSTSGNEEERLLLELALA